MAKIRYAEGLKVLPVIAPQNMTSSAVSGTSVLLQDAHWMTFIVQFGAFTSDSTDVVVLTVESSTGSSTNSNDEAIAFSYRLGAAVGTDSMGAITAATSDGATFGADSDANKIVIIDVDPAYVAAKDTDAAYLRVVATPSANVAGLQISALVAMENRYPGNSMRGVV